MVDVRDIDDKDKIEPVRTSLRQDILRAMVQAVAVFCVYLGLSLTDVWGYFPPIIHGMAFGAMVCFILMTIALGVMGKSIFSLKASLQALFLSLVMTAILILMVGSDRSRLIEIALKPQAIFPHSPLDITMTVTPPIYSGRPPFTEKLLTNTAQVVGANAIPVGSLIVVRVGHASYAPTLIAGHQKLDFLEGEKSEFVAQFTIQFTASERAAFHIMDGSREIGQWPMIILEDDAPKIEQADYVPIVTADGLFGLVLNISDDYGIHDVTVGAMPAGETDIVYDQTRLAVSDLKTFIGDVYVNLTASELAGSLVNIVVDVTDAAGQTTREIIPDISLPERNFTNSLAQKIIDVRKKIHRHPKGQPTAGGLPNSSPSSTTLPLQDITLLGAIPDSNNLPPVFYTALRSAYWRLLKPKDQNDLQSARDILWDLADNMDGPKKAALKGDVLAQIASLKLSLYQAKDVDEIQRKILELDDVVLVFLRAQKTRDSKQYDLKMLRQLYERILTQSYYGKYDEALDLASYCEQGFIYSGNSLLYFSGQQK